MPASVLGQWQARRLGVDPDDAGLVPWLEDPLEEEEPVDDHSSKEKKRATPRMKSHENKQRWIQIFLLHSNNGRMNQATLQQTFVTEYFY